MSRLVRHTSALSESNSKTTNKINKTKEQKIKSLSNHDVALQDIIKAEAAVSALTSPADQAAAAASVPNHSTFSKNRHGRFRDSDLLRHLFETTVARCIADGLVSGQGLAADASLIEADANKQNSTRKEEWDHSALDPNDVPRAVKEYLDVLDDAAFGAASSVEPKFTSHSDPSSQWTAARKGPAFFSYSTNYLIDTDHSVIVDVEGTRSIRQAEVGSVRTMLDRIKVQHDIDPERLIADSAYGSGPMLGWLVDRDIKPHIPVLDKSGRTDGTWSRADFKWDPENNQYICPDLKPRYRLSQGGDDLSLHIVDRDMGDEVRSTRSLSGGERFLVSLDAESLDMAMDALENLQAQGRTIGVISHVEAMKDRIPVQVRVSRHGAGASTVSLISA